MEAEAKIKKIIDNPGITEQEKKENLEKIKELKANPAVLIASTRIINRIRISCRSCHYKINKEILREDKVFDPNVLCGRCRKIYNYELKR